MPESHRKPGSGSQPEQPDQPEALASGAATEGQTGTAPAGSIPAAAVGRLSLYLRELRHLGRDEVLSTSSHELGRRLGVSAAVVRRDLACLGQLGRRGVGYDVAALSERIRTALGADQVWNVALIGAGSLGTALLRYRGFSEQGFQLRAAYDVSRERIGSQIGGVTILDLTELEATLREREITLAILAVPAEAAQEIADRLVRSSVTGILNFAPVTLRVGRGTCVANVDLASELQQLSFAVARQSLRPSGPASEAPAASEVPAPAARVAEEKGAPKTKSPEEKSAPRLNASGRHSVD